VRRCLGIGLLSGIVRALVRRLYRPTASVLVVDDHRGPCIELAPDLPDFGGEEDFVDAVVGPLTSHERFNNAAQGVGTEPLVGNDYGRDASFLRTGVIFRGGLQSRQK